MKNENLHTKNNANYIYGRISSLSCIGENKAKRVFLQKGFNESKIFDVIRKANLEPQFVEIAKLDELSKHGNHQGIVVEAKPYEYSSIDEIISKAKKEDNPIILILDEVEDPHNFGAILRSCDAFGVVGVIIKSRNQVPLNMTVAKVSTGAVDFVKVAQVSNLNNAIAKLKDNGFWIYAAEGSGTQNYNDIKFSGPVCVIVGSEGKGISELVLKNSDIIMKIPMIGHVNSLNVSVSVGILLSRIRNK